MDYTKDTLNPSQRAGALKLQPASMSGGGRLQPASMSGGGRAYVSHGGGYTGVAFLPQRPIGGMMGRMSYGPRCAPVFKGELYQGGGKEKDKRCSDCEKSEVRELSELQKLFMRGGGAPGLITPFSAISTLSPMIAKLSMTNIISIILLIFAHSYVIQYGEKKSTKKKMLGGGSTSYALFSQILRPLGSSNLIAIATLLLLHYFAVRHKRLSTMMSGGGNGFTHAFDGSVIENEMKIKSYLGKYPMYQELESIFLTPSEGQKGGQKYEKKKSALHDSVSQLPKEEYIASGLLRLLKKLFSNFFDCAKSHDKRASSQSVSTFKRIFNTITPISVALYLQRQKRKSKNKNKSKK